MNYLLKISKDYILKHMLMRAMLYMYILSFCNMYVQRNVINCCKTMNSFNSTEHSKQLHIKVLNYGQSRN